jgi:hypothetical protein
MGVVKTFFFKLGIIMETTVVSALFEVYFISLKCQHSISWGSEQD